MKVVINKCYGGFGLSAPAQREYAKRKGKSLTFYKQTKYEFRDGVSEYTRIDGDPERSLFVHAVTKDCGPTIKELPKDDYWYPTIERTDPDLIAVVEEMGSEKASGDCAKLRIVEIPDGTEYEIDEYDGRESIHEAHRSWY